jgi:hypothetical protein
MPTNQANYSMVCDGCVEIAVTVAAGAPTVTVGDTNGTLGTVTAGNNGTFNDYLWNGNTATISIADGQTVSSGAITGTIKYTNCPTPTATPAATPAPTPSPTPGAATILSCGASCASPSQITAIGVANKYQIDVSTGECWYEINLPYATWSTKKIYVDVADGVFLSLNWWEFDNCKFAMKNLAVSTWTTGKPISSLSNYSTNTTFRFAIFKGVGASETRLIWIDD